jgi:hypothetical protein
VNLNKLALHALGDEDEFIIVSLAKGSEDAKLHFQGDEETLVNLLSLAQDAIVGEAPELH